MSNSNEIKVDNEQLPRKGSVMFNFHYQNEPSKQKTLKRWKKINKYLMVPLYRIKLLPLLGFGKIFLILITKGWKTGKKRRTPLEYRKYEGDIIIFAARGENATWVKNLRAYQESVLVMRGFHKFKPEIESISDINQKIDILKWYITKFEKAAKMLFGWNRKKDDLDKTDLSHLASLTSIFKLKK
ncbi:MAG: nitroreductase/quinone reductase family protein [Candidatus Thorarchaeota archaeon]